MNSHAKKFFYGLISVLALMSLGVVGSSTNAQAASKQCTTIPKRLRGYWYAYPNPTRGKFILHITAKHIYDAGDIYGKNPGAGWKTSKKEAFLYVKKHAKEYSHISKLSKKVVANKTFTFYQTGKNSWRQHYTEKFKYDKKFYKQVTPFYLKKIKGKTYLKNYNQAEKIAYWNRGGGNKAYPDYTKVSTKYLKSIGFYK